MLNNRIFPIEGKKVNVLTLERCVPDFNDLGWQTFDLLTSVLELENPGENEEIVRYFRMLMGKNRIFRPGTVYANPCGAVRSPQPDTVFFQTARQSQREWFGQFNDALGSSKRVKKAMSAVDPLIRQLTYTGVLFIDNRHIFPDRWPDIVHPPSHERSLDPGKKVVKRSF